MTEKDANLLFEEGHSLHELIELFSDKQEQRDLYINSGLVYKYFEKIIEALKKQIAITMTPKADTFIKIEQ